MRPVPTRGGAWPAYRLESRGGTKIGIRHDGRGTLRLQGPLSSTGEAAPVLEIHRAEVSLTLPEAGVYRLLPVVPSSFLQVTCYARCHRTEVSLAELLKSLSREQADAFLATLKAKLANLPVSERAAALLNGEIEEALRSVDSAFLDRFPSLPRLAWVMEARELLGVMGRGPIPPVETLKGRLLTFLASGKADRSVLPPVEYEALPLLRNGHYLSNTATDTQLAQSPVLARVLTALARDDGSYVDYRVRGRTRRIKSPRGLFAALLATGHTIESGNEASYANFLSYVWDGVNVRLPVWLDTGLDLANGERLNIPMGHSQQVWQIFGPDVNAKVGFYLGISGVGFFPELEERPGWTGKQVRGFRVEVSGARGHDFAPILAATRYFQRIQREARTVAKAFPADGYGLLGVCQDSTAAVEAASRGTCSCYPLVRKRGFEEDGSNDGLARVFCGLPDDVNGSGEAYRADALCRIWKSTPHALDATTLWDPKLRAQLAELRREVGAGCAR